MNSTSDVTFVISTFNRCELLENEVSRIRRLSEVAEVVVIDDGSEDDTNSFLVDSFGSNARVKLIRNERNRGTAFCWNLGIASSRTEFVMLLHDDTLDLLPNLEEFLRELRGSLRISEVVGVHVEERVPMNVPGEGASRDIVAKFLYALAGQVISTNDSKMRYSDFVPGVLALRRDVGVAIKFDDKLLAGYGFREESDFQLRAKRAGFRILYNPRMGVIHRLFRRGGQKNQFSLRGYAFWALRNQLIFMRKNHLALWPPRYAFFIMYQIIMHRARPSTIESAVREGLKITA